MNPSGPCSRDSGSSSYWVEIVKYPEASRYWLGLRVVSLFVVWALVTSGNQPKAHALGLYQGHLGSSKHWAELPLLKTSKRWGCPSHFVPPYGRRLQVSSRGTHLRQGGEGKGWSSQRAPTASHHRLPEDAELRREESLRRHGICPAT